MTIEDIYNQTVKPLPASDRLRLATLILNDLSPHSVVDYSDEWSAEDQREATLHSLRRASVSLGEEGNPAQ